MEIGTRVFKLTALRMFTAYILRASDKENMKVLKCDVESIKATKNKNDCLYKKTTYLQSPRVGILNALHAFQAKL